MANDTLLQMMRPRGWQQRAKQIRCAFSTWHL